MLNIALRVIEAEQTAIKIDGGLGLAALEAVTAQPAGPARRFEARKWARIAQARGVERIATLIAPGLTADEIDALTEWHVALHVPEAS